MLTRISVLSVFNIYILYLNDASCLYYVWDYIRWGYSSTDSIGPAPRVEPLGKNDFRYPQEPSGKKLKLKVNGCSMIYTDSSGGNRGKVIDGCVDKTLLLDSDGGAPPPSNTLEG